MCSFSSQDPARFLILLLVGIRLAAELSKLGYLDTRCGRGGGIQRARSPEDIRIGKLVREMEDQRIMVECFDTTSNTCRLDGLLRQP